MRQDFEGSPFLVWSGYDNSILSSPSPFGFDHGLRVNGCFKRMMREVKVWTSLTHSNVVAFYGWILECPEGGNVISAKLVSHWCEGGTVLGYLKRNPHGDRRRLGSSNPMNSMLYPHILFR